MNINGKTIFITGADGGIGYSLLKEFINRDAKKIYAAGINKKRLLEIEKSFPTKVKSIELDVINIDMCLQVAEICSDTDILVNNAGVECAIPFMDSKSIKSVNFESNVNYIGVHNVSISFKDILTTKNESVIVNILSVGSFIVIPKLASYCASKSAAHVLTEAMRKELNSTNVKVHGVYPGYVDTEMTRDLNVEKVTPESISIEICDGISSGDDYIFPDYMSKSLSKDFKYKLNFYTDV